MKKLFCALLVVCLMLPMAGCWNYRGLNELTIVAGMAIDKYDGEYLITFEVMDLQKPTKIEGPTSKLVFSQGASLFEAIRNAKRQLASKLYFGNMQIVIISQQIAEQDGLNTIMDFALRDAETRETMEIIVSREETARDLLMSGEKTGGAVSYDISRIIREDSKLTGSVFSAQFYRIFNELKMPGISVALPSFYLATEPNSDKRHIETYGSAVFRQDKLAGFLSAEESKYLLMVDGHLSGGALALSMPSITPYNISLEIKRVDPSMSYENQNGKITAKCKVVVHAYFAEYPHDVRHGSPIVLDPVTRGAEKVIKERIQDVIQKLQTQYQADVLGMGNMVYRTDLPLWKQISGQWDEIYQSMPVEVTVSVKLVNTAMTRDM